MNLDESDYRQISITLLDATARAGGIEDVGAEVLQELIADFENAITHDNFDTLPDIGRVSNLILAAAYPKFKNALVEITQSESMPGSEVDFDKKTSILLVVQGALDGVACFDDNEERRNGAKKIAKHIKSPLPTPTTPFDDVDPYMTFE
ncbi:hypothetical protein Mal52_03570 [Symmachiella dynata]|uniref:Uncharacterized protein n=1 Tax=Symmachiella dynata TaxID=2527995 RepID=A0A517ZHH7_9PLAN|nr:hypothetical protein [Symmachiella dynata]QDU41902.1 hypothetical protein Mal52_03570 [Symmachiella dynata]